MMAALTKRRGSWGSFGGRLEVYEEEWRRRSRKWLGSFREKTWEKFG
jgi:hypothetical protein